VPKVKFNDGYSCGRIERCGLETDSPYGVYRRCQISERLRLDTERWPYDWSGQHKKSIKSMRTLFARRYSLSKTPTISSTYTSLHYRTNNLAMTEAPAKQTPAELFRRLEALEKRDARISSLVDRLEARVEALEGRLDSFDRRLLSLDTRDTTSCWRVTWMDGRIDKIEDERLVELGGKLDKLGKRCDKRLKNARRSLNDSRDFRDEYR
jgi:chromosome segregation ATPase